MKNPLLEIFEEVTGTGPGCFSKESPKQKTNWPALTGALIVGGVLAFIAGLLVGQGP